ncbi:MAG: SPOR domain-containing protein [Methylococcaceae bacterium]
MDSELKQRLIGAVVVTALATIFIPMLFDDPVDTSGQAVSELSVPAMPSKPNTSSANKLPTRAEQVLKARNGNLPPEPEAEKVVETEEETELPVGNKAIALEDNNEQPISNGAEIADDPNITDEATALDTGVVDEAAQPNKAQSKNKVAAIKPQEIANVDEPESAEPIVEEPTIKGAKNPDLTRWAIQAGTFSQKDNAYSLQESLRKQGLPASVEVSKTSKGTPLYKIKIGPSLDKKRAAAMKATLDKQNIHAILIPE